MNISYLALVLFFMVHAFPVYANETGIMNSSIETNASLEANNTLMTPGNNSDEANATQVLDHQEVLDDQNNATQETLPDWIAPMYPEYSALGKPDPFVSFVKIREYELMEAAKRAKKDRNAATPLETVEVHSLKLIGIIENKEGNSVAMVELPDGKGYLIRTGMIVGLYDGVVTSIGNGVLDVEENITDVFGESKQRVISLRMRQE